MGFAGLRRERRNNWAEFSLGLNARDHQSAVLHWDTHPSGHTRSASLPIAVGCSSVDQVATGHLLAPDHRSRLGGLSTQSFRLAVVRYSRRFCLFSVQLLRTRRATARGSTLPQTSRPVCGIHRRVERGLSLRRERQL